MFVVDTNVILYAADKSSAIHAPCRRRLLDWRRQTVPWFVTWGILYEFLRVATHPRVFRRPLRLAEAWTFLESLLDCGSLTVLSAGERHREILAPILEEFPELSGNVMHDVHTVAIMREHGIHVIYTRDTDFHRFPDLDVRDPVR